MIRSARLAFAALALGSAATGVSAAPVAGSSAGTFSKLSGCDSTGTFQDCRIASSSQGADTRLEWGSGALLRDFSNPSTLTATAVGWNTTAPANDVVLARLDWRNRATLDLRTPDHFSARWNLSLMFTQPAGSPDPSASPTFALDLANTGNPQGDRIGGFTSGALSGLTFDLTGVALSDLRFSVSGGGSSLGADGTWFNPEGSLSTLVITADISQVPEPASLALLGLGAIGLGLGLGARRGLWAGETADQSA